MLCHLVYIHVTLIYTLQKQRSKEGAACWKNGSRKGEGAKGGRGQAMNVYDVVSYYGYAHPSIVLFNRSMMDSSPPAKGEE
jgi:hypothetical protein